MQVGGGASVELYWMPSPRMYINRMIQIALIKTAIYGYLGT